MYGPLVQGGQPLGPESCTIGSKLSEVTYVFHYPNKIESINRSKLQTPTDDCLKYYSSFLTEFSTIKDIKNLSLRSFLLKNCVIICTVQYFRSQSVCPALNNVTTTDVSSTLAMIPMLDTISRQSIDRKYDDKRNS